MSAVMSAVAVARDVPEAKQSTGKPKDRGKEGKSHIRFPLLTRVSSSDVAPGKDVPAVERTDEVHKQAESHHPSSKQDEIQEEVEVCAAEWDEPDQSEQDREGSDDFSVDESSFVASTDILDRVEVVTCQASDDSGKGELADA